MTKDERVMRLRDLVEEVTKDQFNVKQVQELMVSLKIPYSEEPMELLNNILLGIHQEGHNNEESI